VNGWAREKVKFMTVESIDFDSRQQSSFWRISSARECWRQEKSPVCERGEKLEAASGIVWEESNAKDERVRPRRELSCDSKEVAIRRSGDAWQ
jgi:hypothetical protein